MFQKVFLSITAIAFVFGLFFMQSAALPAEAQGNCPVPPDCGDARGWVQNNQDPCTAAGTCSPAECARIQAYVSNCALNNYESDTTNRSLPAIIGGLLRGLFGLLGTVFLVLIIYGGFIWMTAQGNDENINRAKKIITQAAIGLLIIVIAYALTEFIFNAIFEATQTPA